MDNNIVKEALESFKYYSGYKKGVVISEQVLPAPDPTTPEDVRKIIDQAKQFTSEYNKKARVDARTKRRQGRTDRKTCNVVERAVTKVQPTDIESLKVLCPMVEYCVADGQMSKDFKFEPCKAYKTSAQPTQTDDRLFETGCVKKYKNWFTPNKEGVWEEDKITYKGKNKKGEEVIFTYKPEGENLGVATNMITKATANWDCKTTPPPTTPPTTTTTPPITT